MRCPAGKLCSKITEKFVLKKDQLKSILADTNAVAVTTDGWTLLKNESFLGVTVHYIHNWEPNTKVIEVEKLEDRHRADNIAAEVFDVLDQWDIRSKAIAICTDSAKNMIDATKMLKVQHLSCSVP